MSTNLVTFSQVVAKAQESEPAARAGTDQNQTFGKRAKPPQPDHTGGETPPSEAATVVYEAPDDHGLALEVTTAIARLQDAMDAAIRSGLMVEPAFKTVSGRFNEFGLSVDSHLCTVQMYRKLA